ncbi:MAG: FAD-dependent oxidoreductase [Actinomycetota bacterium]|nr:FAD-dependent oxidoreductase [Actinomycetota bacterium]
MELLIVGSGGAAGACLGGLLRCQPQGRRITVATASSLPIYERPILSKGYLTSDTPRLPVLLDRAALDDHGVVVHERAEVDSIDLAGRTCGLTSGVELRWDQIVIATGSDARVLPVEGHDLAGVLTLRGRRDADRLRDHLRRSTRVVIIGAGLIGLEVAAAAVSLGAEVDVVEAGPRALGRVAPPEIAHAVAALHRQRGVRIHESTSLSAILGDQVVKAVMTSSGVRLEADTVVIAVGSRPRDTIARRAGLPTDDGVLVTPALRSVAADDVFAIGDVARVVGHPFIHGPWRSESWRVAQQQGSVLAANLDGEQQTFDAIPWFWSDQYDMVLQGAGVPSAATRWITRVHSAATTICFGLNDGQLTAVSALGPLRDIGRPVSLASRAIARRLKLDIAGATDPTVALDGLLR